MKQSRFSWLMALALLPVSALATDQFYINNGLVTFPPQVDAINFVNNGTFNIFTSAPFDTSNTRNFTNNGTMLGAVGFRFDTAPAGAGTRIPAANFVNRLGGTVEAFDVLSGSILVGGPGGPVFTLLYGCSMDMAATNIVSEGLLAIGAGGTMKLTGGNVNLKRSGIGVLPIEPNGSYNDQVNGLYQPDIAVYDNYWGQSTLRFNSSGLITPFFIASPVYPVTTVNGNGFDQIVLFGTIYGDFYTNIVGGLTLTVTNIDGSVTNVFVVTNEVRQAMFVGVSDPAFDVSFGFTPSSTATNPYQTSAMLLEFGAANNISAQTEFFNIYLSDTLAAENFRGLLPNITGSQTFRPANYNLSRLDFGVGNSGNAFFDFNFFYDPTFTNATVDSEYAGYSAFVDHVTSRPPAVSGGTVTNIPGRVTIKADSLDMSRTRMRGEGLLDIQANHLITSSNASVDGPSLSFSFGSTNNNLVFQNLANTNITRLTGDIRSWSGVWMNFSRVITTNYSIDTNGVATRADFTNVNAVRFHALIVDAEQLSTSFPVSVYDFKLNSANVTVNDAMNVVQSFKIDAQNLTVNGSITLSGALSDWTRTNTPSLRNFTNNGFISIANEAHLGDDAGLPYNSFVNRGIIAANGQTINSDYLEITGTNSAFAGTTLIARSGKVENGTVSAGADLTISGDVFKFNRATIRAGNRLYLNVTGALFDNGGGSGNLFDCRDGFVQTVKPATGDLLGTTIRTFAPNFASVRNIWAGEDRGASKNGFLNNTALGRVIPFPEGFDPEFVFQGAGVGNALYVDFLDLSLLTNYASQLVIEPNMTIYFAASSTNAPEEQLDGQLGGRLRWVKDFAGPNSSVLVLINGQTVAVNRALRFSKTIDSDNDGIPNFYDLTPFDTPMLTSISRAASPGSVVLSWPAQPGRVYQIDVTTNPALSGWQMYQVYTNGGATNCAITIPAPAASGQQRFYRVSYKP